MTKVFDISVFTVNTGAHNEITGVFDWAYAQFIDAIARGDKVYSFSMPKIGKEVTFILDKITCVSIDRTREIDNEPGQS